MCVLENGFSWSMLFIHSFILFIRSFIYLFIYSFIHSFIYLCIIYFLFILILCVYRKERNVLFNDALNTFFYGYMASDLWQMIIQIAR